MNTFKKALYILSWIPVMLLHVVPLVLLWPFIGWHWWLALPVGLLELGLIIVPLGLGISGGKQEHWPDIFWLWGNEEEWIPQWWLDRCAAGTEGKFPKLFPGFQWLAIRNPIGNLRFIFKDREAQIDTNWKEGPMEARQMIAAGQRVATRWAWSGPFAGYRRVWLKDGNTYSEVWVGWKVGSTVEGLGFTFQVRLNREVGT